MMKIDSVKPQRSVSHDLYYLWCSYCYFEPARATLHCVNRQGWSLQSSGIELAWEACPEVDCESIHRFLTKLGLAFSSAPTLSLASSIAASTAFSINQVAILWLASYL